MDDYGAINILLNERNSTISDKNNQINNLQTLLDKKQIQLQNAQKQLQSEINSKDELERKLTRYRNKYENQKVKINSLDKEINNIRTKNKFNKNKIINLLEELKLKNDEIENLNLIIKVTKCKDKLKEPITISFSSAYIKDDIICHFDDNLLDIEEKLFKKYPQLNRDKAYFLYNGNIIDNNKSVFLNGISDQAKILIMHND